MAFVPALIIPGVSFARVMRHLSSDERDNRDHNPLTASETRKQSVVDRMVAGSSPPVSYWSDKQFETMMKTNSAFRDREVELRAARGSGAQGRPVPAPPSRKTSTSSDLAPDALIGA